MPTAELPTGALGWLVAIGAGIVGFLAGFIFIKLCNALLGSTA